MDRAWIFVVLPGDGILPDRWSWTKCDDGVAVHDSTGAFSDFSSCVFDAALHGYTKGDTFQVIKERRMSRRVLVTTCVA